MRKLLEKLRRDSWGMGIFLGFIAPAVTFGILVGIIALIATILGAKPMEILNIELIKKLILLSIVPSVFIMRHYLLKLKFDLTGRGILVFTFVIGILFAILEFTV